MKKVVNWLLGISLLLFVIALGVVGVKILTHNYELQVWGYIALACWIVLFACLLYKVLNNRCPACGKLRRSWGKFCPYCGKECK